MQQFLQTHNINAYDINFAIAAGTIVTLVHSGEAKFDALLKNPSTNEEKFHSSLRSIVDQYQNNAKQIKW